MQAVDGAQIWSTSTSLVISLSGLEDTANLATPFSFLAIIASILTFLQCSTFLPDML